MLTRVEWLLATRQRTKAIEVLRESIAVTPDLVKVVIPLLQSFSFTREELAAILPNSVDSWMQCGSFLERTGNLEDAVYFWQHALDFLCNERKILPQWFDPLYTYYRQQKDSEKALEILRLGIEKIPDYPRFHEWLGDYYAGEGIIYRALEEYQQVLLLEPLNESIRGKVEKLQKPQLK